MTIRSDYQDNQNMVNKEQSSYCRRIRKDLEVFCGIDLLRFNLIILITMVTIISLKTCDITIYKTLYILDAEVEPAKGNEFCRVGIVCHLHLSMKNVGPTVQTNNNVKSVMYEVLAEQSVWAVCGRTAGVVCFDAEEQPQTVVLDVMPLTSGHLQLPLVRISKYIPGVREFRSSSRIPLLATLRSVKRALPRLLPHPVPQPPSLAIFYPLISVV
ncbi:hypothetical protein NQ318_000938 [Aromia moschata]|uniref:TRAPPC10/Trs130 C-terminal domain-containing protein n=1 Tax=Aromia moschata TaxID=1265417 RepID=A0AAV8ZDT0_9CUCU|nr:hypothetical protein NQ318_000938 [Aromia moschata]